MTDSLWCSQTDLISSIRNLVLAVTIVGVMLLPVMIAEGCVKRPRLEPTPGVSQTDVVSSRQHEHLK